MIISPGGPKTRKQFRSRRRRRPLQGNLPLGLALIAAAIFYFTTRNLVRLSKAKEAPHASPAVKSAGREPRRKCADRAAECSAWAADQQCDTNPAFMITTCPSSCGGCPPPYLHDVPEHVLLGSNHTMPAVGFGTAGLGDSTQTLVAAALKAGYTKVDSAQAREWYREDLVGAALEASTISRPAFFITTKVHPRDFGAKATRAAVQRSITDLHTSYLDLVLLHYAECWGDLCKGAPPPEGTWKEAWRALEQLVDERVVRSIGVSNFAVEQIAELARWARVRPALVQLNSEPLRPAAAARALCRRLGIQFESYSTLGGQYAGQQGGNPVLGDPLVKRTAQAKGVTPAQVVLRWALQSGQTVVPRTTNPEHMLDNLMVLGSRIDLSDEEMDSLGGLAAERRRR